MNLYNKSPTRDIVTIIKAAILVLESMSKMVLRECLESAKILWTLEEKYP